MYLYIHGFASGSRSRKAIYLAEKFATVGVDLTIPDFNQGGFSDFTISRQLQQAMSGCPSTEPVTIIGSSLGGWAALLLAQQYSQVEKLVLMAPAFGFPQLWLERLGTETLKSWQESGNLSVYHHAEQQQVPLNYQFVTDAQQYLLSNLERNLPTLILHGQNDAVVPIELSRNFVNSHDWAKLIELNSDHGLGNVLDPIWQEISQFCDLTLAASLSHSD
jgi:pimeloyl-ACP methyl ester carboxylesterase